MAATSAVIAGALLASGAAGIFRSPRRRGRLRGLAAVALGGLLLTFTSAPDGGAAMIATTIGAATLVGLLAVAWLLERAAEPAGHRDLDLQQDPLRWH